MRWPTLSDLPPPPAGRTGWPWTVERPRLPDTMPNRRPWPRISIVTPSYNQGQFIEETIRSVLLQGYPRLEYIIIDGGSSDQSVEIIQKYARWLTCWVSEKDQGQSDAINKGFARASGEIFGWLNSDDFLVDGALRIAASAFPDDPAYGALVGRGHKIDRSYRAFYSPLPAEVTRASLMNWCYGENFMQPACLFSRRAWQKAGPLRTDLNYCIDLALWLEIAGQFAFKVVPEDIAYIHSHASAKTVAQRTMMFGETALLLASLPGGFPAAQKQLQDLLDGRLTTEPPFLSSAKALLARGARSASARVLRLGGLRRVVSAARWGR